MGIQNLVRLLFPREDRFFDLLGQLAALGHEAARELAVPPSSRPLRDTAHAIQAIEHRADSVFHEVEASLARTFVTPIDREDIHALASELDDVIDLINLSARACALYRIEELSPPMQQLVKTLERCAETVAQTIPMLKLHDYPALLTSGRNIRLLEKEADTVFRDAVSLLFHDDTVDAKTLLKHRDVLQHLEAAVDKCDRVGNTLSNLAVKHG
jgi:uncharacterized protein Yka (UPF0111/DUF47 family)